MIQILFVTIDKLTGKTPSNLLLGVHQQQYSGNSETVFPMFDPGKGLLTCCVSTVIVNAFEKVLHLLYDTAV